MKYMGIKLGIYWAYNTKPRVDLYLKSSLYIFGRDRMILGGEMS